MVEALSIPATQPIRPMKATEKQVSYALSLLAKAGYSTRYMDSTFKELGVSMRERSGMVSAWLANMSKAEISQLIEKLK
jgi:hypothetical protein